MNTLSWQTRNACLRARVGVLLLTTFIANPADAWAFGGKKAQELAAMPELHAPYPRLPSFGKGDIFVIFAHADDELTVLSQVARYRELDPNRGIHWILVSDNGAGQVLPWTCWFQSKVECRYREAAQVANCINIEEPESMGFPDGGLASVPDLGAKIWQKIEAVRTAPVAAIFSHDATGLYGHPDHVAVHDAVSALADARGIPFISIALPEYFKQSIEIRDPFKNRQRPSITHAIDLDASLQEKMVCAHSAHKSQEILLWFMDQKLPAKDFYSICDRMFFHLTEN